MRATRPCSELVEHIARVLAVEECHSVAGGVSMLLKVRVESPPALLALVERLREIPGVEGTETTIVLATQFDRPFTSPPVQAGATRVPTASTRRGRRSVTRGSRGGDSE